MRRIECLGFLIILILAIFLAFYSTSSNVPGSIPGNNLDNPIVQLDGQMMALENFLMDLFIPTPKYVENSTGSIDSIGKISDGYWYVNATAFAQHYTKYMAMSVVWYDASGNVISARKVVWNQSNLEAQQSYPIHVVSYMKNKATPSKVKVSFFDDPIKTSNDSRAFISEELNNGSIAWLE